MHRITRTESGEHKGKILGFNRVIRKNGKDLVDKFGQRIERRLNRVLPLDGGIATKNLLKDLGARDETWSLLLMPMSI